MKLQDIINLQRSHLLNDSQFAKQLGVGRETWNKIKNGKRPLNDKFLMRVYRAFPEANIFFSSDATKSGKVATPQPPNTPETSPDGSTGGFRGWLRELYSRIFSGKTKNAIKSKSGRGQ